MILNRISKKLEEKLDEQLDFWRERNTKIKLLDKQALSIPANGEETALSHLSMKEYAYFLIKYNFDGGSYGTDFEFEIRWVMHDNISPSDPNYTSAIHFQSITEDNIKDPSSHRGSTEYLMVEADQIGQVNVSNLTDEEIKCNVYVLGVR